MRDYAGLSPEQWDIINQDRISLEDILGDMYPTDEQVYVEEED